MAQMKTPGVYIIEKNAFPNSVVEVATAIPAFIGHTQFARDGNKDLTGIPFRISSMAEFHSFFGFAPTLRFGIRPEDSESEDTTNDINVLFPDGSCQKRSMLYIIICCCSTLTVEDRAISSP